MINLNLNMKNVKRNNLKDVQVNSLKANNQINRISLLQKKPEKNIENQGDTINVERLLKDFKSEKSQTKTERSKESAESTNKMKQSNIVYQSYTNRYNNSTIIKNLLEVKKNFKNNESNTTLKIDVTAPFRRVESQTNRYKKKQEKQSETHIVNNILDLLKEFQLQNQNSEFETYMESVVLFNEKLSRMTSQLKEQNTMRLIITSVQGIIKGLSKKCLMRLYDKQSELEVSADENLKSMNQAVQQQYKIKYERKINKLIDIINQKEKKEREVTKLFYYLRKNGVNLQDAWKKASREEKKQNKIQKFYTEGN